MQIEALPEFGVEVTGFTSAGAAITVFRRKMPNKGWVWASRYINHNIKQEDIVAWTIKCAGS